LKTAEASDVGASVDQKSVRASALRWIHSSIIIFTFCILIIVIILDLISDSRFLCAFLNSERDQEFGKSINIDIIESKSTERVDNCRWGKG